MTELEQLSQNFDDARNYLADAEQDRERIIRKLGEAAAAGETLSEGEQKLIREELVDIRFRKDWAVSEMLTIQQKVRQVVDRQFAVHVTN